MAQGVSLEQLEMVARYLSWMQKIFLGLLVSFGIFFAVVLNTVVPPSFLILIGVVGGLAGSLLLLVCTYRCASGSGRSGVFWLLMVLLFKWMALIVLCYLTRKWLISQGVKVKNLGLAFELPESPVQELESPGFSRF